MESPNKRLKQSPPDVEDENDYVPLGGDGEEPNEAQYGYSAPNGFSHGNHDIQDGPRGPRLMNQRGNFHGHNRNNWNDPRNAKDGPKSKHALPGHEPWILVKTRFGRRFVHNTETKESLWHIPQHVFAAVLELDKWEVQQKEKNANAKWAEEQLKEMRGKSKAEEVNKKADEDSSNRRRRSESLQKEDEAAMMAELAAEAEKGEEQDAKEVMKATESLKPVTQQRDDGDGYGSDSSYEEVEVTDSEFEDEDRPREPTGANGAYPHAEQHEDGPVEFGEDDIAYQLAAMGEEHDIEPDGYGDEEAEDYYEEADDQLLTEEDAANLFRDMLDDHRISPFTRWDKLIGDESDDSIVMDDRYTVLPSMKTRKEVWESWVKNTAARLKDERAKMEKLDPRIPYLAFLDDKATPKLYWPEFKRKYKKEAEMNDRKLGDKDREKLYRDHVTRLKLPESTRKADLINSLKSIPLRFLNRTTTIDTLPQQLLSNLYFISLPSSARNAIVEKHISMLSAVLEDEDGELIEDQRVADDKKRLERRRKEDAMAERERKVDEQRRQAEKEERWAKKDLREEENELRRAMAVDSRGIQGHLEE